MNYALDLSLKPERCLEELVRRREAGEDRESPVRVDGREAPKAAGVGMRYGMQYSSRNLRLAGGEVKGLGARGGEEDGEEDGEEEENLEEKALGMAIEEVLEESGRRWRPWAANGRSCRLGEIILLVDSDTVGPEVRFWFRCFFPQGCRGKGA